MVCLFLPCKNGSHNSVHEFILVNITMTKRRYVEKCEENHEDWLAWWMSGTVETMLW